MILITGLTGFSGRSFYKVLCRENYKEKIRVLVRPTTDLKMFENSPLDIEFVEGDILDKDSLKNAVKGCDTVFHIAAKDLARNLVEAISEENRHIKCIFVSSTIVYSNYYRTSYLKTDEEDPIEPIEVTEKVSENSTYTEFNHYWKCGSCGSILEHFDHCDKCGRKIKWEGNLYV